MLAAGPGHVLAQSTDPNVSNYHRGPGHTGLYVVPALTLANAATAHLEPAFTANIPGPIYAQPLYYLPKGAAHGLIIVATDVNTVYALDAGSGAQVWQTNVGPSVPGPLHPCGRNHNWGVAGTPVLDEKAGAVYLDAEVLVNNVPKHQIFGLSLANGSVLPGWPIDVESAVAAKGKTFSSAIQDQRGGLQLMNGNLYLAYGGHGADCGDYHGWVLGVQTSPPSLFGAWSTRNLKGGIWGPGGVVQRYDSLFVNTGNGAGAVTWGDEESTIRLDPTLAQTGNPPDWFTPLNWQTLDQQDQDLATAPFPIDVPLPGGLIAPWMLTFGKDGNAYLLDRTHLGGFGGQLLTYPVAAGEIVTGPAAFFTVTSAMVAIKVSAANCSGSTVSPTLTMLQVSAFPTAQVSTAWCVPTGSSGSPMVTTTDGFSNPIVWIVGAEGDQQLHGYNGLDGTPLVATGFQPNRIYPRWTTLIAAENRLYAAGTHFVSAFSFNGQ